uniref:Uncharacterized protein n=1 Tax=Rhizophora mucronata TaxID=61149 RepID=A0A2P2MXB1_RHIMU
MMPYDQPKLLLNYTPFTIEYGLLCQLLV